MVAEGKGRGLGGVGKVLHEGKETREAEEECLEGPREVVIRVGIRRPERRARWRRERA